jgi:hypothetical protein
VSLVRLFDTAVSLHEMTAPVFVICGMTAIFTVEFVDEVGVTRRGPLAALWSTRFECANPARSFPSYRGQKNFSGLYYAATMDTHVGFESWAERDVAMTLDFDPDVVAFASQPFWLIWTQDGDERRHAPDYFARLADGTCVVIDVRADDRIEPRDAEAFAATDRACLEVGWMFRRMGGPDSTLAANVRWLAGYRHSRCYRSDVAEALLEVFTGGRPLISGALNTGDPVVVLPVLYHLMWKHELVAELREGLLGAGSLVVTRQEGANR